MTKKFHEQPERPAERLLSVHDIETHFTLSRTTLWRYRNNGSFPQPIHIGARRIAWRESEVMRWLDDCSDRNRAA